MIKQPGARLRPTFRGVSSLLVAAFLLVPLAVDAATVVIPASRDNTLFLTEDGSLSSGSGEHFFSGSNGSLSVRRGIIAFDVATYVPAGSSVDSVALVLNVSSAPNEIPQMVDLHRLLADWGEGTSASGGGAGAPSTVGDATWLHSFYPGQFWNSPGGDFTAVVSATQAVGVSGPHAWSSASMTVDVQAWLDQPGTSFGWLLRSAEGTASSVRRFDAHENATESNRPHLFVRYTQSTTPARQTTWGEVKFLYYTPTTE